MLSSLELGRFIEADQYQERSPHLSAHEELLDVVALAGHLAQPVGGGVSLLVRLGVLPLELDQGDLQPLHDPEQPEDEDEDEEAGPARHLLPHACLLLHDGVADHNSGE